MVGKFFIQRREKMTTRISELLLIYLIVQCIFQALSDELHTKRITTISLSILLRIIIAADKEKRDLFVSLNIIPKFFRMVSYYKIINVLIEQA